MPDFMTDSEFAQAGYNVQLSYKPYIGEDELRDAQVQGSIEGCEAYYTRNFFVTQCVLAATEDVGGDVLLIGHASTLDACAQQLVRIRFLSCLFVVIVCSKMNVPIFFT